MAKKTKGYVDTSAFIAFLDRSDSYHSLFLQLFADPPSLVTSSLVIAEGHAWFLKRYDSFRAIQFLNFIEDLTVLSVEPVGMEEIRKATRTLRQFSDQGLTCADAVGLLLMNRYKIESCWSTDRHLSLTGIPLVIHQI
jgi:predicted nucleic acid-binding protein